MARTALTQLQSQLEAIRREAYAAGYAAAMQSIRDLTTKAAPAAPGRAAGTRRRGRPAAAAAAATPAARTRRPRQARAAKAAPRPARATRPAGATRPARAATRPARATGRRRPQRGTNARMIEEILQSNAPRALRPAEIRTALQRDKGVAMAFTSIRHALGQLEGRHTAEQVGDSKTWRYRTGAAASS